MTRAAMMMGVAAGCAVMLAGARSAMGQSANPEGAIALETAAPALLQGAPDYAAAAGLYRRAASLRPGDDPQVVEDLRLAGLLYAQAGKLGTAGAALERAGERAMAAGLPGEAAEAFTNAAYVAARSGNSRGAAILAYRALVLVDQDGVSPERRESVRRRLAPALAAYLGA